MDAADFSPGKGMRLDGSENRLQITDEEDWKWAGSSVQAESKSSTDFCGVRNDDFESGRELNYKKSKHSFGLLEVSTKLANLQYGN